MKKSAKAFRTITEVSDEIGVASHVLRFWEGKFSQIKPTKRGGNRRYYRPKDVDIIRGIQQLLHTDKLSIKDAKVWIREHGVKSLIKLGSQPSSLSIVPSKSADIVTTASIAVDDLEEYDENAAFTWPKFDADQQVKLGSLSLWHIEYYGKSNHDLDMLSFKKLSSLHAKMQQVI